MPSTGKLDTRKGTCLVRKIIWLLEQLMHLKSLALPTAQAGTRKTVVPPRETPALHVAVFTKRAAWMSRCTGKSSNNIRPY